MGKYNSSEWIGKKYGKLTVIGSELIERSKGKQWYWKCRCRCGKIVSVEPYNVLSGHTLTCGCGKTHYGAVKHGESSTKLYIIWAHMIRRCNPKARTEAGIKRYAMRGICVCNEWMKYENFASWAKANGYREGLSIERIDNDGNYCPENCKWIDRKYQARNRGTTHYVEYKGRIMSLAEACELAGMPYKAVFDRVKNRNWSVEDALSIPVNATRKWKRSERPGTVSFHANDEYNM